MPSVKWQVTKEIQNKEINLVFAFKIDNDWSMYAINPDTISPKISARINFQANNDCFYTVGQTTSQTAIVEFDKELNMNTAYFMNEGAFSQRIVKRGNCLIKAEISYIVSKKYMTEQGEEGIIYRVKDILLIPLD
ncbi:hypothetical protein VB796_01570 [Arcicella sp. LKC2W]|uniref:hypothetical protein n=1 Tax=Arcicella sp. LKC2W TaxID=2984198 RepID=UPI002B1EA092|nr:hypothetical protein [Arcicella sp. LKC2W]MEA5457706.1 hypothetical protein [Arcicella sp. LKC2W]